MLTPTSAIADGINLSWSDCGTSGQETRVFACDTNAGSHTLGASFSSPIALDSLVGNEAVIDLQSNTPSVSPWWQIRNFTDATPACRNDALSLNLDFTGSSSCHDYWSAHALGGTGAIHDFGGDPKRQRILVVGAILSTDAVPLAAELETYAFGLTISNIKTVGGGACGGCMDGALLVLTSLKAVQIIGAPGGDVLLTNALDRNYVTWAPGTVPTVNKTWGGIKSMYR